MFPYMQIYITLNFFELTIFVECKLLQTYPPQVLLSSSKETKTKKE